MSQFVVSFDDCRRGFLCGSNYIIQEIEETPDTFCISVIKTIHAAKHLIVMEETFHLKIFWVNFLLLLA